MRATLRLLAKINRLEPFAPTGLTGLVNHPSPRPALIQLYNETLTALKSLPESSVYRQSTEALTRHRLSTVQAVVPQGYDKWLEKVKATVEKNPEAFAKFKQADGTFTVVDESHGKFTRAEWDDERAESSMEGPYSATDKAPSHTFEPENTKEVNRPSLAPEPPLSVEQVNEIENKIGAGLLEEVILVAEGELALVHEMARAQVWEELVEKPAEGQWKYFERGPTHTGQA